MNHLIMTHQNPDMNDNPTLRSVQGLGWIRDLPDPRDLLFTPSSQPSDEIDLSPGILSVYDQSHCGSCTGNAISAADRFSRHKQGLVDFIPSRLMIYFAEREIEGTIPFDCGASIRDGIKALNSQGTCDETLWPYDISQFATKPSDAAYQDALKHEAVEYRTVEQTVDGMMGCLSEGYPIIMGATLFPAFHSIEVARTGIVPMPDLSLAPIGGHAFLVVGGSMSRRKFKALNSWGEDWGMGGYFEIDFEYALNPNLADDLWMLKTIAA